MRVRELRVGFGRRDSAPVVDGVSFELRAGRALAIVGESGSGKSVTARAIVGLAGPASWVSADALEVLGASVLGANARGADGGASGGAGRGLSTPQWRRVRGRQVGLVVQDALVSLDPLRPIGREIADGLRLHTRLSVAERRARVLELLRSVGMPEPEARVGQRSGELSGGLRQRALIAAGLSADPPVLIADEPTTALDATVQSQILALLEEVKARGTALLFISHDLAVVSRIADDVLVLRDGHVVESGPTATVLGDPQHEYTRALLRAVPTGVPRGVSLTLPAVAAPPATAAPPAAISAPAAIQAPAAPPATPAPAAHPVPPVPPVPSATEAPAAPREPAATPAPAPLTPAGPPANAAPPAPTPPLPLPLPLPLAYASPLDEVTGRESGSREPRLPELRRVDGVLELHGVRKSFPVRSGARGAERVAVDDVSLVLERGTTLGLVGESGSGKTTLARIALGLTAPDSGTVTLDGEPWAPLPERQRRPRRHLLGAVYQDALSSFDPRLTVEQILTDALRGSAHRSARVHAGPPRADGASADARESRSSAGGVSAGRESVARLLDDVGLASAVLGRRPLELSGGQRQRVSIARALAADPAVLICDEPVSALDVSIQAQILDLFDDLQRERGLSYLFISHDLGVVQHMSDRIAVMKDGRIVEEGPTAAVFGAPTHPYTQQLLAAAPRLTVH